MVKFLITSDNHLGYNETNHLSGNDSFRTFDEILQIANKENVDFILQGGDLFHENKPSRNTYNKTIQILRKYLFSSDNKELKTNIHAIHGNHDDPSGFNSVSPMDILHSTGLINYFGKITSLDSIKVEPILIKVGNSTKISIAVYGLGYLKDRRLFKLLEQNKVKFIKQNAADFHILMVHQNRAFRKENYWPEEKLPEWMDLVIFGHEHLSEIITTKHFKLIQVGSSVRTSLCLDEVGEKYTYLVTIDEHKKMHIERKALQSVRFFKMKTFSANAYKDEKELLNKIKEEIDEVNNGKETLEGSRKNFKSILPLLRLRIECEKYNFVDKFKLEKIAEGKIANPKDFIRFLTVKKKKEQEIVKSTEVTHKSSSFEEIFRDNLAKIGLNIIDGNLFIDALKIYLDKGEKDIFSSEIDKNTQHILEKINLKEVGAENYEDVIKRAYEAKENNEKRFKH